MDSGRHPRLERYVRRLPRGLLSYPECESKASMYRNALDTLPRRLDTSSLDPLLASYVDEPVPLSSWVPEVVNSAVFLAIADQVFGDEQPFLKWVYDVAAQTFRAPTYRLLMAVASPRLLASGAARRWQAFHRGTPYDIEVGTNGARSHIEHPPHLFDPLVLAATAQAILAAYHASGARHATYEVVRSTPTDTRFRAVWFPEKEASSTP